MIKVGMFIKKHLKFGTFYTPGGEKYRGFKFTVRW